MAKSKTKKSSKKRTTKKRNKRRTKKRTTPKRKTKSRKKTLKKRPTKKRKSSKKRGASRKPKKRTTRKKPTKTKRSYRKKRKTPRKKYRTRKKPKTRKTTRRKPKQRSQKRKSVKRKRAKKKYAPKKKTRTYPNKGSLEQLFESGPKVRIMKLFFRNPEESFLFKDAAKLMRMRADTARKEMKKLETIGLLRSRKISPRKQLFSIDHSFNFLNELRELILKASPVPKDRLLKTIRKLGKIKMVLVSGIFLGEDAPKTNRGTTRTDLLIVGDNVSSRKVSRFIKNIEAEAGTNVNCAVMSAKDFKYRYNMYDRFVRDLINEKSEFLMNKLKF